jgi:hypothetical protein
LLIHQDYEAFHLNLFDLQKTNRYTQNQELLADIDFVREVNFEMTSMLAFFAIRT